MSGHKRNINQVRAEFIQGIYDKFDPSFNYYDFRRTSFGICASIGLHFHKEVRAFFEDSRWQEEGYQAELMEEIKTLLEEYIK